MAKASKIESIVAEMKAERSIVLDCIDRAQVAENGGVKASEALMAYGTILLSCISRLSGNGTEPSAPKVTRTRKSRKALEPSL